MSSKTDGLLRRGVHRRVQSAAHRGSDRCRPRGRVVVDAQLGVQDAVAGMRVRELGTAELSPFNRDGRLLTNVNTPEDYARAQAR